MRKLFLHIGAHKTGTTSLQSLFCSYRDQLKDQGIIYSKSCLFQHAQHRIAFSLKNMKDPKSSCIPDFEEEIEELKREVENSVGGTTFLISSEEFLSLPEDKIEILLNTLYKLFSEIEILVTLRRQDNQFISIYNQKVKSFGNRFFRHYTKFIAAPTLLDAELEYDKYLFYWESFLNKNSYLKIFVYEQERNISQAYFDYISKGSVSVKDIRVNKSVSVAGLEFVRNLKARSISEKEVERLGRLAYKFFPGESNESLLSSDDRRQILNYFDNCNRRIENKYGVDLKYDFESCENEFDDLSIRRLNVNDVFTFFLNNR